MPVASGHGLRIREIVSAFELPSKGRTPAHPAESARTQRRRANILGINGATQCRDYPQSPSGKLLAQDPRMSGLLTQFQRVCFGQLRRKS